MTDSCLTDFELDVLRSCAGEKVAGLPCWGAAVGQALECLAGSRYIVSAGNQTLTDKGRALYESLPALVPIAFAEGSEDSRAPAD
jgi:hypothetical protein